MHSWHFFGQKLKLKNSIWIRSFRSRLATGQTATVTSMVQLLAPHQSDHGLIPPNKVLHHLEVLLMCRENVVLFQYIPSITYSVHSKSTWHAIYSTSTRFYSITTVFWKYASFCCADYFSWWLWVGTIVRMTWILAHVGQLVFQ